MYLEDRVMNICAALDSFDKVRRNTRKENVYFVNRIKECIKFAGDPFAGLLPTDADAWAVAVKEVRNDLAHHEDRFRNSRVQINYLMSEQLFWLFAICMLRLAQAPQATFDAIARHRQVQWLSEQANAGEES